VEKKRFIGWMLFLLVAMAWMIYNERIQLQKRKEHQALMASQQADSLAQINKNKAEVPEKSKDVLADLGANLQSASSKNDSTTVPPADPAKLLDSNSFGPARTIILDHPHFKVTLNTQGARITSILSKEIKGVWGELSPNWLKDSAQFLSVQLGDLNVSKLNWRLNLPDTVSTLILTQPQEITFTSFHPQVGTLTRSYFFHPDSHGVLHKLKVEKLPQKGEMLWEGGLVETETLPKGSGFGLTTNFFSEVLLASGPEVVEKTTLEEEKTFNDKAGSLRWLGLRRKYTAILLHFKEESQFKVKATPNKQNLRANELPSYNLALSKNELKNEDFTFTLQFLPLQYNNLLSYNQGYEKILFSGYEALFRADIWYVKLCGLILKLLLWFHSVIPNWGVAIILLTLLVRFGLLPLTIAQTRSMAQMQAHMPATKAIKERNKGNTQKANKELMEYYKAQGINPLAGMVGCLPMFLQLPVFIALFHVLGRAVELKEAGFMFWITDLSLPDVVWPALAIPWIFPEGLTILPILMAITMFFQMKLTITDPNQKPMVWLMPFMMFFFSASFPSGLVLYWSISNTFTIVQTMLMKKPALVAVPPPPKITSKKK